MEVSIARGFLVGRKVGFAGFYWQSFFIRFPEGFTVAFQSFWRPGRSTRKSPDCIALQSDLTTLSGKKVTLP